MNRMNKKPQCLCLSTVFFSTSLCSTISAALRCHEPVLLYSQIDPSKNLSPASDGDRTSNDRAEQHRGTTPGHRLGKKTTHSGKRANQRPSKNPMQLSLFNSNFTKLWIRGGCRLCRRILSRSNCLLNVEVGVAMDVPLLILMRFTDFESCEGALCTKDQNG